MIKPGPNHTRAHQHFLAEEKVLKNGKKTISRKSRTITHVHAFAYDGHVHGAALCERSECNGYENHGKHA